MRLLRRFTQCAVLVFGLLVSGPVVGGAEAVALAPPEDDCEAWYVGTVGEEEWWYFECVDEGGDPYHGWLIFPV